MTEKKATIQIRFAGITEESVVDGPGLRSVVFFQGCPHHCPGCHNPETWDFEGGSTTPVNLVWESISDHPLLQGITLSGGRTLRPARSRPIFVVASKKEGLECHGFYGLHLGGTERF